MGAAPLLLSFVLASLATYAAVALPSGERRSLTAGDWGSYTISNVAGSWRVGAAVGDGGPGTSAITRVSSMATDAKGNLYLSETTYHTVRIMNTTGTIMTIAGSGAAGFAGDLGPATSSLLNSPSAISADSAGNVYIADQSNHRIRKLTIATQIISTIAGTGVASFSGDGGDGTLATLNLPSGIAVDAPGNVYFSDTNNNRIRVLRAVTNIIMTVAGSSITGFNGDGSLAIYAALTTPRGIAVDEYGNIVISDSGNNRVRMLNVTTGIIITVIGTGYTGFSGNNGPGTSANIGCCTSSVGVAAGKVYVSEPNSRRILILDSKSGILSTQVGNGTSGVAGDGKPGTSASIDQVAGIAVTLNGDIYIADGSYSRIVRVFNLTRNIVSTVVGGYMEYTFPLSQSRLPPSNNYYFGDGNQATSAQLYNPCSVAVDSDEARVAIADTGNNRVRSLNIASGIITLVAGDGSQRFAGDAGLAVNASLYTPLGVAFDTAGNIYISDRGSCRIRKVVKISGVITTVAGTGGASGSCSTSSGDGGQATNARLDPRGLTLDALGNIFFAEGSSGRIRKITVATGIITSVVGTGVSGFSGDGGPGLLAQLNNPQDVAADLFGNLYVADASNHRIRRWDALTSTITTVAGTGSTSLGSDAVSGLSTSVYYPRGVAIDACGNVFIVILLVVFAYLTVFRIL